MKLRRIKASPTRLTIEQTGYVARHESKLAQPRSSNHLDSRACANPRYERMSGQRLPDARAYRDALSDPISRADIERRVGKLKCLRNGLPKVYTGTFSTTFHCETPRGDVALRCFTRSVDDLERHVIIADFLRNVRPAALCRTQYLAHGIRIGDASWPAIEMEWIAGRTLNVEVEVRLEDSDAMLDLAARFREAVQSLGALGIAHGDLQHGNILVADGHVRLIDYDAMFVPALAGLSQTDYGDRNYQHPQRRTAPFDGRLDRFSSIVIYTALIALAADRSLWARFDNGGNMLFRVDDFTTNGSSELFRTLLANPATSGLAQALLRACRMPVEAVPTLEQVIEACAVPTTSSEVAREAPPPRRPTSLPVLPLVAAVAPASAPTAEIPIVTPPLPPPKAPRPPQPSVRRRLAPLLGLVALFVFGVLASFAITVRQHRVALDPVVQPHAVAVALVTPTPELKQAVTVIPESTATHMPSARPTVTAFPKAKAVSKAKAVRPVTSSRAVVLAHLVKPRVAATSARSANIAAMQGAWQIVEANVQDGSMVWRGNVAVASAGTLVVDAYKESVAGVSASRCERQTVLSFAVAATQQTVPYREVNCAGTTSRGEVLVNRFSPSERSFSGTFWQGGVKLGAFTARKL